MSSPAVMMFRVLAGLATICMVSSPSLLMYRIHKQKHVGVASVFPLAALLANSHVWMMYGYIEGMWFPVFACFLYGECCAIVFLSVYTYYSSDKRYVTRTLAVFLAVLVLITVYTVVGGLGHTGQSTKSVGTIVGILADCAGICLYGAPMEKLFQVLKHKSAAFINVHMVIAGLVNNSIWLVYGILITNWFIISINVLFVSANTFTLCLYRVYDPRTHPLQDADGVDDEQGDISVCIDMTTHMDTKKSLTSLPSPEYSYMSSPKLELDSRRESIISQTVNTGMDA
uniref:MtN3-like protein n=1 Tax=Phytophthora ramorum TaxID=164328 RepID=H3GDP6_PHYRM